MKIIITGSVAGFEFPYASPTEKDRVFIREHLGKVFTEVKRISMNYYKLKNGICVHVYNACELPEDKPAIEPIKGVMAVAVRTHLGLRITPISPLLKHSIVPHTAAELHGGQKVRVPPYTPVRYLPAYAV